MKIGTVKEIKVHEYRVGLTPSSVSVLTNQGHEVFIETNAGQGIGFSDLDYKESGATICNTPEEVFAKAELIVKVKEPQPSEIKYLKPHHILFTFLHLAPDPAQTEGLIKSGCMAIAYETVTDDSGRLPLLAPMSEVAGKLSIQMGAHCLEKSQGGNGILLGGVPGVSPATVVIIGAGVVGTNALQIAVGMGSKVVIVDKNLNTLRSLSQIYGNKIITVFSTPYNIDLAISRADLVIGAVLIPGAAAPKLVTRKMLKNMRKGAVIVDVAIDQGGCFETSKVTSFDNPTYVVDDIIHYCVANLPGSVARTSTVALNNVTLPFIENIAKHGAINACKLDKNLANGVNVFDGKITCDAVASELGYDKYSINDLLNKK